MADDINTDLINLSNEITAEVATLITSRVKEAGYVLDVYSVPIVATIGLNIVQIIANSADIEHPGMKRQIGWLSLKRIKADLL
jgi:hypothetical protein